MNLAVHGLSGDVKEANTFYDDAHKVVGKFDFVMANPPFNVKKVDYEKSKETLDGLMDCHQQITQIIFGYNYFIQH